MLLRITEYKTSKSRSLNNAYVIGYGTPKYVGETFDVSECELEFCETPEEVRKLYEKKLSEYQQ